MLALDQDIAREFVRLAQQHLFGGEAAIGIEEHAELSIDDQLQDQRLIVGRFCR